MKELDEFYLKFDEPQQSTLLALRSLILSIDDALIPAWKYGGAFFCYNNKNVFYLWVEKKTGFPYIGVVEGRKVDHPLLHAGNRSRIKILPVNPYIDLPVGDIKEVLTEVMKLYKTL